MKKYLTPLGQKNVHKLFEEIENDLIGVVKGHGGVENPKQVVEEYYLDQFEKLQQWKNKALNATDEEASRYVFRMLLDSVTNTSRFPNWKKGNFGKQDQFLIKTEDAKQLDISKVFLEAFRRVTGKDLNFSSLDNWLPRGLELKGTEVESWLENKADKNKKSANKRKNKKSGKKNEETEILSDRKKLIIRMAQELHDISEKEDKGSFSEIDENGYFFKFAKSGISILDFIATFNGGKPILKLIDNFGNKQTKLKDVGTLDNIFFNHLPLIFTGIYGLGSALGQNLLKDLGYPIIKNDLHINRAVEILTENGLVSPDLNVKNDVEVSLFFEEMALYLKRPDLETLSQKTFYMDKLLWLMGNHKFHKHKCLENLTRRGKEADEKAKEDLRRVIKSAISSEK